MVGKLLELSGFVNIMYELMKAILIFWFVPFASIFLYFANERHWGGLIFQINPLIGIIGSVLFGMWAIGCMVLLTWYIILNIKLIKRYHSLIPIEGKYLEYFDEICTELNIKVGKVELVQDYRQEVPCIGGLMKTYVILPAKAYSKEQLRVIFIHELTHYKQGNQVLRHFASIAKALHFFNPIMWLFHKKILYWGEYACDYETIPKTNGMKKYFETIFSMTLENSKHNFLQAQLVENESDLERRMKQMKRSYKMKKKSRMFALVVVGGMVLLSGTSVHAATLTVGEGYYNTLLSTTDYAQENAEESIEKEFVMTELEAGVVIEEGETVSQARTANTFIWTLNAERARKSANFNAKSGGRISVSATTDPANATIRLGIIDPKGSIRYINVTGSGAHTFTLNQTGTYSIYAQNMTDSEVTIAGSYSY